MATLREKIDQFLYQRVLQPCQNFRENLTPATQVSAGIFSFLSVAFISRNLGNILTSQALASKTCWLVSAIALDRGYNTLIPSLDNVVSLEDRQKLHPWIAGSLLGFYVLSSQGWKHWLTKDRISSAALVFAASYTIGASIRLCKSMLNTSDEENKKASVAQFNNLSFTCGTVGLVSAIFAASLGKVSKTTAFLTALGASCTFFATEVNANMVKMGEKTKEILQHLVDRMAARQWVTLPPALPGNPPPSDPKQEGEKKDDAIGLASLLAASPSGSSAPLALLDPSSSQALPPPPPPPPPLPPVLRMDRHWIWENFPWTGAQQAITGSGDWGILSQEGGTDVSLSAFEVVKKQVESLICKIQQITVQNLPEDFKICISMEVNADNWEKVMALLEYLGSKQALPIPIAKLRICLVGEVAQSNLNEFTEKLARSRNGHNALGGIEEVAFTQKPDATLASSSSFASCVDEEDDEEAIELEDEGVSGSDSVTSFKNSLNGIKIDLRSLRLSNDTWQTALRERGAELLVQEEEEE